MKRIPRPPSGNENTKMTPRKRIHRPSRVEEQPNSALVEHSFFDHEHETMQANLLDMTASSFGGCSLTGPPLTLQTGAKRFVID